MAIFSNIGLEFLFRWLHYLFGITWIGLLYYFNFVQTPSFAEMEANIRTGVIAKLVPRALWYFRWAAMFTLITGLCIVGMKMHALGASFYDPAAGSYGWTITLAMTMAITMWANVWFVIWPNQKVVIASAQQVAGGGQALPEAAARGRRAALASRTNVVFSIPMLFFMSGASRLQFFTGPTSSGSLAALGGIFAALIVMVEANALIGTQGPTKKPLDSVVAAIHTGIGLAILMYLIFEFVV